MISDVKPSNFVHDVEVVGCLINCGGEFVLLQRQPHKIHGNKWGQPAGKVDPSDKSYLDAIKRELGEETGITDSGEIKFHKTFYVSHPDRNFLYHYFVLYLEKKPQIVLSSNEHKDSIWVNLDQALKMDLIPDEDYCLKNYYGLN